MSLLAELFGIKPNDLSNRKKSGTVEKLAIKWAKGEGVSLNWLIRGQGKPEDKDKNSVIKEENNKYEPGGGWQQPDIKDRTGYSADHPIWSAYNLLVKIYESENDELINNAFDKLKKLSGDIGISRLSSLNKLKEIKINIEVLTKIIIAVEKYSAKIDALPIEKKARLYALLYERQMMLGKNIDDETVLSFLKLVD